MRRLSSRFLICGSRFAEPQRSSTSVMAEKSVVSFLSASNHASAGGYPRKRSMKRLLSMRIIAVGPLLSKLPDVFDTVFFEVFPDSRGMLDCASIKLDDFNTIFGGSEGD